MEKRKIDQLVEAFAEGRLTRRDFIKKATVLGLSLAASVSIGRDFQSREAYAAEVDRSKLSKRLNIYNWSDYVAEDTVPNFEKEFGVKVTTILTKTMRRCWPNFRQGRRGMTSWFPRAI